LTVYANGFNYTLNSCHITFRWLGSDKYEFVISTGNRFERQNERVVICPKIWLQLTRPEVLDVVGALKHALSEYSIKEKTDYKAKLLKGTDCFLFGGKHTFGILTIIVNSQYLQRITIRLYHKDEVKGFSQALEGFVTSEVVEL